MAIKRVKKETNYTIINNTGLKDEKLSLKSKGLLAYMLSLPDDWVFYEKELINHSTDGRDSVRKGLRELEEHGYLVRERARDDRGKLQGTDWLLHETPQNVVKSTFSPKTDFPMLEKPTLGKPTLENPLLLSTNSTKDLSLLNTNNTNDDEEEAIRKVILHWQQQININESGIIIEDLSYWVKDMNGNADLIIYAINEMIRNNGKSYKYLNAILKDWESKGINTVEMAEAYCQQRSKKTEKPNRANYQKQSTRTETLPGWAKDEYEEPPVKNELPKISDEEFLREMNAYDE
ncbi:DnaD domain protein [Carnobacterium divergens]|uniref:DnaD domain protein n=1 Tax=Carnobacterium divergens TaxID=2748 RepID=UPI0039B125D3